MNRTKRLCSIDSCENIATRKGMCPPHYGRKWRYGDPLVSSPERGKPQRFFKNEVLNFKGEECLFWPYLKSRTGYAVVSMDSKRGYASRYACEAVNGPPPTPGHEAAHSCGNGRQGCVNPGHLSWKTPKENSADKIFHGTSGKGEKNPGARLTSEQVLAIRSVRGSEPQHVTASRFGVSRSNVQHIQTRNSWGWL